MAVSLIMVCAAVVVLVVARMWGTSKPVSETGLRAVIHIEGLVVQPVISC